MDSKSQDGKSFPNHVCQKKKRANSGCVSIIEHSTKSPRRIDIHCLSSARHLTDWQEPNTLRSWTSRMPTTMFESRKETNIKQLFRPSWGHTNIESCLSDYATHQQHSNDGSTRSSWNTSTCAASSTWTMYSYTPTTYNSTNKMSGTSSKQKGRQEWRLNLLSASSTKKKRNT